jgi:hypothetical protein
MSKRKNKKKLVHISFGADEIREFDTKETAETVAHTESTKAEEDEIRYYCIYTGDTDIEVRQHLIDIMSDPRNIHGRFCHLFFVSSTGTTGIDIHGGRNVISTQPFWHMQLWNQFKHRCIRYGAADALPPNERTVQPIILRSTLGPERDEKTGELVIKPTTDVDLFIMGVKKEQITRAFIKIIAAVTLECLAGVSDNPELCRNCIANGKPLASHDSFWRDSHIPNNCTELDEYLDKDVDGIRSYNLDEVAKHGLKEVQYERTFYYKDGDKLLIYEPMPELNKVILMSAGHPYYMILKKIIERERSS